MKPKTSPIWNYFLEINNSSAKCKICDKIYSRKGRTTTALKSHLKSLHFENFAEFEKLDKEKKQEDSRNTADDEENTSVDDENSQKDSSFRFLKNVPKNKFKKSKAREVDRVMKNTDVAYNFFKEIDQKLKPDECSLYCDLLCIKLRRLKETTRDNAMMEIDRLIYNLKQQDNQILSNINNPNANLPIGHEPYTPMIPSLQPQSLLRHSSTSLQ